MSSRRLVRKVNVWKRILGVSGVAVMMLLSARMPMAQDAGGNPDDPAGASQKERLEKIAEKQKAARQQLVSLRDRLEKLLLELEQSDDIAERRRIPQIQAALKRLNELKIEDDMGTTEENIREGQVRTALSSSVDIQKALDEVIDLLENGAKIGVNEEVEKKKAQKEAVEAMLKQQEYIREDTQETRNNDKARRLNDIEESVRDLKDQQEKLQGETEDLQAKREQLEKQINELERIKEDQERANKDLEKREAQEKQKQTEQIKKLEIL